LKEQGGTTSGSALLGPELLASPALQALQQVNPANLSCSQLAALLAPICESIAASSSASPPGPPAALPPELAVTRAQALAARTSCANPRRANLSGPSEAAQRGKRCGGSCGLRYCSEACSRADWRVHRAACRLLRQQQP